RPFTDPDPILPDEGQLAAGRPGEGTRRSGHLPGRPVAGRDPQLAFALAKAPGGEERELAATGRERVRPVLRGHACPHLAVVEPEIAGEQVVGYRAIRGVRGVEQERDAALAGDQPARDPRRELAPGRAPRAGDAEQR